MQTDDIGPSRAPFADPGASWIWPAGFGDEPNQYVEFRHEFVLAETSECAQLHISVDSNYAAWVNGEFVGFGQYHDFPNDKVLDSLDVSPKLRAGSNTLCILAYYQGEESFQYLKGRPGLLYSLTAGPEIAVSGSDTVCRKSPAYHSGPTDRITPQLGFTFEYDAGSEDDWRSHDYVAGPEWTTISSDDIADVHARGPLHPRPIEKLRVDDRVQASIIAQGSFVRRENDGQSIAELMQTDCLSPRHRHDMFPGHETLPLPSESGVTIPTSSIPDGEGVYLVLDVGREEAGILEIDLESSAPCEIDIAWGEHLDDLRVRASVGGRNFACRYVCREGRQTFTHYFTRLAGRYLQVHVPNLPGRLVLYYAGLRPTEYPVEIRGSFASPNALQGAIHRIAVRTLHLCMHEHYEDCPWREQSLYGMDSRNQAISGYYCFGDYRFPAASFKLLGDSLKDDGYLELCAPATISVTIPSFSMAWIIEVAEHLLFSGDLDCARAMYPTVTRMMSAYIAGMQDGLLPSPRGDRYWQFYDWADGLDGTSDGGDYWLLRLAGTRFDAPLNGFYCLALESAAMLADNCGIPEHAQTYRSTAAQLRSAFHPMFWDGDKSAYRSYVGEQAKTYFAELTQSLAILSGVCPPDVAETLRTRLSSDRNGLVETTLSQSIYKFEALLQEPETYGPWVFSRIARDWGHMLFAGATSFWETIKGGDDFFSAGSLCHGWSGIPVYFYGAYLLGIKPLEPGFRRFTFAPIQGIIPSASGSVPTPHGPIEVSWENVGGEVSCGLVHPEGIEAV